MRLWIRIFISILFVSLASLFASSVDLINKNHIANIEREQERIGINQTLKGGIVYYYEKKSLGVNTGINHGGRPVWLFYGCGRKIASYDN